jgi:hypothetical protein
MDDEEDPSSKKSNGNGDEPMVDDDNSSNRRAFLQTLAATAATVALPIAPALAGKPEYDKTTGELYSSRQEMLSGGSAAARGISVVAGDSRSGRLQPGQALQTVYDTRFITYLSRFLLNFDPAANAWWVKNAGLTDTWDIGASNYETSRDQVDAKFAEFAESVEIGLADYFVGPYGSYSSLQAMKAGIEASQPAKSSRDNNNRNNEFFFFGLLRLGDFDFFMGRKTKESMAKGRDSVAKQGVLNLYTLLKASYPSIAAKRQLAILFSFFSKGDLQPVAEIQSLLGEADNATLSQIDLVRPFSKSEAGSRTSSRRGGGYSASSPPTVSIQPPPALGSNYIPAKAKPIMKPTTRVLNIRVVDGGEGYTEPPEVFVSNSAGLQRPCSACAILNRQGQVESVLVLDPGYGYGKRNQEPPRVSIAAPSQKGQRVATAIAELEYEIVGIDLVVGGNGYVATEPPKVTVSPPEEDPDWFVDVPELAVLISELGEVRTPVAQMRGPTGNLAYSIGGIRPRVPISFDRIKRDPIELMPSSVRPERNSLGCYIIPPIAAIPTYNNSPNPRYRAVDPIFGAIGRVPATKSALELKPSEYGRLALSGAVCTVLVRTALNPLELIKTKQQLQNDEDLLDFARENMKAKASKEGAAAGKGAGKIGSLDLIFSLVKLRGPLALFQSADITFLASLVFGSFGFGATELFRRSFSELFFTDGGGELGSTLVLLLAAAVATIITSAAAAPFELLRVRSMGLVESKKWTDVLGDFIEEKGTNGGSNSKSKEKEKDDSEFNLKDVDPKDLLPLWAGFPPTASRELAFAIPKFLAFDLLGKTISGYINSQADPGSLPVQVGVGTTGLAISAIAGAVAGLAGALVSHPADLVLTYMSASTKKTNKDGSKSAGPDWREVVNELLSREGGIANLFVGLSPRLVFFFLVVGLQFFLYDYAKNLLNVGSEDLSLVLDVFYAVRQRLIDMTANQIM